MLRSIHRIFWKKGMLPIYLIFNVTNKCNSNCSTCFAWQYLNKDLDKELKITEIGKISKSLGKIEWLLISGGEPFLRKDLPEVIKIFYEQNKVRRLTIPTNSLSTEKIKNDVNKILELCPKLKIVISLSIDGIDEKHDEIRGVPGAFEKLKTTYKELVEIKKENLNLSINLNTCLNNQNITELDSFLDYVKKNFKDINFHGFELLRGIPRNKEYKSPSIDEYKKALNKIKAYWKTLPFYHMRYGNILKAVKILSRDMELEILTQKTRTPCYAGSIAGVIYATGDVALCELISPIGNIRNSNYDFKKIWFNKIAEKQRKWIEKREGVCKKCTHSCFISSAILFSPSLYQKLLKYVIKDSFRGVKND